MSHLRRRGEGVSLACPVTKRYASVQRPTTSSAGASAVDDDAELLSFDTTDAPPRCASHGTRESKNKKPCQPDASQEASGRQVRTHARRRRVDELGREIDAQAHGGTARA